MSTEEWQRILREDPEQAELRISDLREDPEGLRALAHALLQDSDPELRAWACRILGEARDVESLSSLLRALEDPEPEVRAAAAWALGIRPVREQQEAVISALRRRLEDQPWVAWVAAEALARYGEAALEALIDGLRHPHPQVRVLAARALARIASPRSIPALAAALEDPSLLVRHFAEAGLDRLSGTSWIWLT
ncbi:HEAT repeat domain-containing protein [Thermoflexus sp.]|uniref:HEAT repeat domain-containing protein n=1 Tax=Thermoflexus sp. TaxID=1969742 RepID=UPI0035E466EF